MATPTIVVMSATSPSVALNPSHAQHLIEYLLMYPGLDRFDIGWEVRFGRKHVDIALRTRQKLVLIECKDFTPGWVNRDARKLRSIARTSRNALPYVLTFWSSVPARGVRAG